MCGRRFEFSDAIARFVCGYGRLGGAVGPLSNLRGLSGMSPFSGLVFPFPHPASRALRADDGGVDTHGWADLARAREVAADHGHRSCTGRRICPRVVRFVRHIVCLCGVPLDVP